MFLEAEDDDGNIVELPARWDHPTPRHVDPADFARFERYVEEILDAFGMDVETPGTRDTPRRFLQALYDATSGSSKARSASSRSASITRYRSTASRTLRTSPTVRSSAFPS